MDKALGTGDPDNLRQFGFKVSRYFLDFLETDFKRQQAPRRRVQLKNDANQTTAVPLRKYEALYRAVVAMLSKEVAGNGSRVLTIPRGRYKALINPVLKNLIEQHIDVIDPQIFKTIADTVVENARNKRGQAATEHEKYIGEITSIFEEKVATGLVHPLLALLDKPIRDNAYSAVESVFEIETDLVAALTQELFRQLPTVLNTLAVAGHEGPLRAVLREFFDEAQARQQLKNFFNNFATSDAWQELRDLYGLTRMGENLQLYLYICDLRFANALYPVAYVPVVVKQAEQSAEFHLELDSNIYVNKRAIDYVAQELAIPVARRTLYAVDERIVYLKPNEAPAAEINRILARLQSLLDLDHSPKLDPATGIDVAQSSRVRLGTALYLGVFDRSDEALLNDYEALLKDLDAKEPAVGALFENIIQGLLLENPMNISTEVERFWDELEIPARLVTETPIPLNEEQRKILRALEEPSVRYVSVQGPPGTGKSHTITAIAFDCILKGRTVLVLSDKNEALDVVEDKLTAAINRVRPNDTFRNPILRLGRTGGTFAKLLTQGSITTIQGQYQAARSRHNEIDNNIRQTKDRLMQSVAGSIEKLSGIKFGDIERLEKIEEILRQQAPEVVAALQKGPCPDPKPQLDDALKWRQGAEAALAFVDSARSPTVSGLLRLMRKSTFATQLAALAKDRAAFAIFQKLAPADTHILQAFVARYEDLRMPLFDYLFRRRKVRAINNEVAQRLSVGNFLDLHRQLPKLKHICEELPKAAVRAQSLGVGDEDFADIYEAVIHRQERFFDFVPLLRLIDLLDKTIERCGLGQLGAWRLGQHGRFVEPSKFVGFCISLANFAHLWISLTGHEATIPQLDFVAERNQLEQLCAAKMTYEMDTRFINFVRNKTATAKALAGVIRSRQKFPTETFQELRDAFPCIIANIREFAEYIPLEQNMFDLVVIDEASQVSVAQAFPALLRAKKVLVLGDNQQFSNVKAAFASNEHNTAWRAEIQEYFRANISDRADRLQRAARFDVKRSVLELFDLIANFSIMLRKHFRGYQELISFSSETFYSGQLQAVKFRGMPIEDAIKFTELEDDGSQEKLRNSNTREARFILQQLDKYLNMVDPPTIGVISPFREQVALLSRMVLEQPNARDYHDILKLKVMTFDTCQGEERDVILYSMVATNTHDALNYIFPADLRDAEERVADALKYQRLNVGFSRAKECIHFVLSKPVERFSGSVRVALQHFNGLLQDKSKGEPEQTDPKSPMEKQLLGWLKATPFFQKNRARIELRPQFPIGDYLRQLDPFYQHPSYRVDFLLIFRAGERPVNVVIEYDGFQWHFANPTQVNAANYAFYYKPGDIERQMTLQSYGYKFLRVNRFNLGSDPVATLSERLSKLMDTEQKGKGDNALVGRIHKDAKALADGEMKYCGKCEQTKPLKTFWDKSLKDGKGGYGRYCAACKRNS
jgi:AAA domain